MKDLLKSIFIEDDLRQLTDWLGLNYQQAIKKRFTQSLLFIPLALIVYIAFGSIFLSVIIALFSVFYYKLQYFQIKYKKSNVIAIKRRMFPSFVKKLLLLLRTNNIYQSLCEATKYVDEPIKTYLIELIEEIDNDKSIKPYQHFADKMEFGEAHQIMNMLYIFNEHSTDERHLSQLEEVISALSTNEIDEIIERKKRNLWIYPNITILTMLAIVFGLAAYMFVSVLSDVLVTQV
jgi:hypothetical protein